MDRAEDLDVSPTPAALRRIQSRRLAAQLKRVCARVPYYRDQWRAATIDPATIQISTLRRLPFTTKDDLVAHDPFAFLAVGRDEIAEVHTTSGTSGQPTITFLTRRDVETWSELVSRVLRLAGVRRGDLIFTLSSFGLSVGGLAWLYGARRLGVGLVPAGPGNTRMKLRLMMRLRPSVFIGTPSYSLYLAQVAEEEGVDLKVDL